MKKQRKCAAIVCAVLLAFAACGGGAGSDEVPETPPGTSKAITGFTFTTPAATGVIDEDAKTIAITVPYGTDPNGLVPTITHTGASISPLSGESQDFSSSKTYTVTAEDGTTQDYEVTVSVALSSSKAITGFTFTTPAATGVIDEDAKTIAITVPYGTNPNGLVPTITHTGASISPASGASQDFSGLNTYTVTAVNGTTQSYEVTVTVALNPAKAITGFTFTTPAATGVIDEDAKTIAITVWGEVNSLTPTITHTGVSISPASGEAQDFSNTKNYTVTAEDGTTQDYDVTVTVKEYALRDTGPAGGRIFYINPNAVTDGWKYLECAPATTEWEGKAWGWGAESLGQQTAIGTGKQNTEYIVYRLGEGDYAAKLCSELKYGGHEDWFLPSYKELEEMCLILHSKKWIGPNYEYENNPVYGDVRVGDFADDYYWSSSDYNALRGWELNFNYAWPGGALRSGTRRVRAVRSF